MKKLIFPVRLSSLFFITSLTIAIIGCGSKVEQSKSETPQLARDSAEEVKEKIDSVPVETSALQQELLRKNTFKLPKSIDRKLFIVAFYDESLGYTMAIVYNNARKKTATLMTFHGDEKISTSKLIPESSVSFREIYDEYPEDRPHYVIHSTFVEFVHTSGSVGGTYPITEVE